MREDYRDSQKGAQTRDRSRVVKAAASLVDIAVLTMVSLERLYPIPLALKQGLPESK